MQPEQQLQQQPQLHMSSPELQSIKVGLENVQEGHSAALEYMGHKLGGNKLGGKAQGHPEAAKESIQEHRVLLELIAK